MRNPSRQERRQAQRKHKVKKNPRSFYDFVHNVQENIEVGNEIHRQHLNDIRIKASRVRASKQQEEYEYLMELYKDENVVNEILSKKYAE